mmetsp:Transcript_53147/g.110860  ORF Transcript_53147/g.110860 Transcript_53147/m.110860 type:complete len:85 (+) Transcript_53147:535-789(+)
MSDKEISVNGDMRCDMVRLHADVFGTYLKIPELVNDHVAYRHQNAKAKICLWYSARGWHIGPRHQMGTDFAFLYGDTCSSSPIR